MAKTHRDPVCNMEVDEGSAAGRSQYQGEDYYFCSQDCKQKFDRSPEQYTRQKGQSAGRTS
jgi:YHS domain-containing protein